MSSGLDCRFSHLKAGVATRTTYTSNGPVIERKPFPEGWYLFLEEAFGSKMDIHYDVWGPFPTYAAADAYLVDNFQNPGGSSADDENGPPREAWGSELEDLFYLRAPRHGVWAWA